MLEKKPSAGQVTNRLEKEASSGHINRLFENTPASPAASIVNFLRRVRSPIANYQVSKGIPKAPQLSFVDLCKALCQHAYNALLIIINMFYNLMPLFDGFTYLIRFMLDKLIDIFETQGNGEKALKAVIFIGELIVLFVLVYFITTIILIPLLHFVFIFINKILRASNPR